MAIQWYPGHMHKAQKEIRQIMPQVDLVIEVLDARIPYSSNNPMVSSLRGDKPCIKILNKSDLADPEMTKVWQEYLEQERGVKTLALTAEEPAQAKQIMELCRKLVPEKDAHFKPISTMIMGIPNVGKSTLINTLAGKVIAKVGNEPAVTKRQQKINLGNGILLSDTPGILWPKFENPDSGYRLAVTGAVKNTAMEFEDVAMYACAYLLQAYPDRVVDRYKLDALPNSDLELLEAIGQKRGCRRSGGMVDLHKASEILLNELRAGTLGQLTFETPTMVEAEEIKMEELRAQKEAEKEAKAVKRKKRKR
jgi:ribosome biogenesis GTPase A